MSGNAAFQVLKARQEFRFKSPIISLDTSPAVLMKKLTEIEEVLAQFDQFTGCVKVEIDIKSTPDDENPDAGQKAAAAFEDLIQAAKSDIFCSAIKPEMLKLYDGSMFNTKMSIEELEKNLKSVLGTLTPGEAKRQLKADFQKLTRRSDINETFEAFLDRTIAKAKKLTNVQEFQNELVCDQFESTLRPMDLEAIDTFCESNNTGVTLARDRAKLLDRKKYFKRSEVETHHVELQQANQMLMEQVSDLTRKISSLESSADNRNDALSNQMAELMLKIDNLSNKPVQVQVHSNDKSGKTKQSEPKPKNPVKEVKKNRFENRFEDPDYFCFVCGLHKCDNKHNCSGDESKFCVICRVKGHVATSRKYHQPAQNSKNE